MNIKLGIVELVKVSFASRYMLRMQGQGIDFLCSCIDYTLLNTPDFCTSKILKLNRKSLSSFIIIRVSGVRVPPPLPFLSILSMR